jgi:thiol-disulfide isomerase/thioredoxin
MYAVALLSSPVQASPLSRCAEFLTLEPFRLEQIRVNPSTGRIFYATNASIPDLARYMEREDDSVIRIAPHGEERVRSVTTIAAAQAVPSLTFSQLKGPPISLSKTDGRAAVINVWATWCPPCRHELPMFAEAAARRKDVAFFFVNAGEAPDVIRGYLASEHLSLLHVLLDPAKAVAKYYGLPAYPATLFVRPDGTIAVSEIGEVLPEGLDAFIAEANGR